jgi:hypothetical protein
MRLWVLLVWLSAGVAAAEPASVRLAVSTHGSSITLELTNQMRRKLVLPIRIHADVDQYDWLSVQLRRGSEVRDLSFELSRDKSSLVDVELAPGGSATETIDLAVWAIRGSNGGPLEPGSYDVEATWDATHEAASFRQTATAKLEVPRPVEGMCKDASRAGGLVLLARQVGQDPVLEVGVHNVDQVAHCVEARVVTHEIQSDWLTVALDATGRTTSRVLRFDDDRNGTALAKERLPPGATSWVRFDLQAWAKRERNRATAIAPGSYELGIVYDARRERDVWNGMLSTRLGFTVH